MGVTVSLVYLPVFCNLKLGSSYEYLELRFNSTVRTLASVMFVIDEVSIKPVYVDGALACCNESPYNVVQLSQVRFSPRSKPSR